VERVKELFTRLLIAETAVGILAFVIVELFPGRLVGIFGAANESIYYTEFAVRAFRVYLCMIVFACVNKAAFIFLQAMGKAAASTILSMAREIVFGVGFALLLPHFYGLDGVLYSMPVSDILTLC
jgi:Na+-driven multidrug efflux pump